MTTAPYNLRNERYDNRDLELGQKGVFNIDIFHGVPRRNHIHGPMRRVTLRVIISI